MRRVARSIYPTAKPERFLLGHTVGWGGLVHSDEAGSRPEPFMNITTSTKIWAHRNFLTVVHQANEIIEGRPDPNPRHLRFIGDWSLRKARQNMPFK